MTARSAIRSLATLSTLAALAGCGRHSATDSRPAEPAMAIRTATAALDHAPVVSEVPATIRPALRATVSAKVTGSIANFPVGLGQTVEAGAVLLTVNMPDAQARRDQAAARLLEAERNADRARMLAGKGVDAADTLRDAEDRLRYAQAFVAEAAAQWDDATVRAPFAGVVTVKFVLPGDLARPGLPLLVIESTNRLRAECFVSEKTAARMRVGDEIPVQVDDAAPVAGYVEEISAAADDASRTIEVKVGLPAGVARSGQYARLLVSNEGEETLWIPLTAVSRFGQVERVFVVNQGRAALRMVRTGRVSGGRAAILAGLVAGEVVVLSPPPDLRDGQPVTVQP